MNKECWDWYKKFCMEEPRAKGIVSFMPNTRICKLVETPKDKVCLGLCLFFKETNYPYLIHLNSYLRKKSLVYALLTFYHEIFHMIIDKKYNSCKLFRASGGAIWYEEWLCNLFGLMCGVSAYIKNYKEIQRRKSCK